MFSMNAVFLTGRLADNPALVTTATGSRFSKFTVAVSRNKEVTDFINVIVWNKTAEFLCKYFAKGQGIAVQGSITTDRYKDKEGKTKTSFEIFATKLEFTDRKPNSCSDETGTEQLRR